MLYFCWRDIPWYRITNRHDAFPTPFYRKSVEHWAKLDVSCSPYSSMFRNCEFASATILLSSWWRLSKKVPTEIIIEDFRNVYFTSYQKLCALFYDIANFCHCILNYILATKFHKLHLLLLNWFISFKRLFYNSKKGKILFF